MGLPPTRQYEVDSSRRLVDIVQMWKVRYQLLGCEVDIQLDMKSTTFCRSIPVGLCKFEIPCRIWSHIFNCIQRLAFVVRTQIWRTFCYVPDAWPNFRQIDHPLLLHHMWLKKLRLGRFAGHCWDVVHSRYFGRPAPMGQRFRLFRPNMTWWFLLCSVQFLMSRLDFGRFQGPKSGRTGEQVLHFLGKPLGTSGGAMNWLIQGNVTMYPWRNEPKRYGKRMASPSLLMMDKRWIFMDFPLICWRNANPVSRTGGLLKCIESSSTLWLFNIAMEHPQNKWRFVAGKIIYFYGPSIP